MRFLERLADQRIQEAIERGELENLKGAGRPIPAEPELTGVAPELRLAYRILKNAGFIPDEIRIRREISEIAELLSAGGFPDDASERLRARYRLLLQKLGESRAANLMVQGRYFQHMIEKIGR